MCNLILPYEVQGYLLLKRESGESPERSGHCIQGILFHKYIAYPFVRRRDSVMICKSGNLLYM